MKYEIKVVRFNRRKMFECQGIRVLINQWIFGDDFRHGAKATITIYRHGQMYDSGECGKVPGHGEGEWQYAIVGLKRKEWNGDHDYAYHLKMESMEVGDTIIVETAEKFDPLRSTFAAYLYGWWPRTKMFRERFPYRGLTRPRKTAAALRRTWNRRIRFLHERLKRGEIPYLNFKIDQIGLPRSRYRPDRPKRIMRLAVVRRAGRNYFRYQGCFFDKVNAFFVPAVYYAHVRVLRDGKIFTSGFLGALGKTGEVTGFEGFEPLRPADKVGYLWWFENFRADMLLPGDTLELESPYKWDLLDSVIREYCHSRLANFQVKRIRRHYPPEKRIEKMARGDYYFETNLQCAFGWDLVERVRQLVRERRVVYMRFEKQRR